MPPRRKSKSITFSLPPEMAEEVQRLMREEGRNMSELVREALRLYMEERELRRQERLERLRSRRTTQEGGGESMSERYNLTPAVKGVGMSNSSELMR